jgi:hypothetical protein
MSDSEIVNEFLVESYENLDHPNRDLIALEKDPCNQQILPSGFLYCSPLTAGASV